VLVDCIAVAALKSTIMIRRIFRQFLRDVPEFDNFVINKSENVNNGHADVPGIHPEARVHGHEIAILKSVLDVKYFMRVCRFVVLHGDFKRLCVAPKIGVVMAQS